MPSFHLPALDTITRDLAYLTKGKKSSLRSPTISPNGSGTGSDIYRSTKSISSSSSSSLRPVQPSSRSSSRSIDAPSRGRQGRSSVAYESSDSQPSVRSSPLPPFTRGLSSYQLDKYENENDSVAGSNSSSSKDVIYTSSMKQEYFPVKQPKAVRKELKSQKKENEYKAKIENLEHELELQKGRPWNRSYAVDYPSPAMRERMNKASKKGLGVDEDLFEEDEMMRARMRAKFGITSPSSSTTSPYDDQRGRGGYDGITERTYRDSTGASERNITAFSSDDKNFYEGPRRDFGRNPTKGRNVGGVRTRMSDDGWDRGGYSMRKAPMSPMMLMNNNNNGWMNMSPYYNGMMYSR